MLKAHFDFLGINQKSTKEDVIKAYREKARKYHSDKGGSDKDMAMLNQAKESILEHLNNGSLAQSSLQEEDDQEQLEQSINTIIANEIPEEFDDPSKRFAIRYQAQHSELVKNYRLDAQVININREYLKPFNTDLYCEINMDGDELNISENPDLFAFIEHKETSENEYAESASYSSKEKLTPEIAISHFIKFIEGKYYAQELEELIEFFKENAKKYNDIAEYSLYHGILDIISTKRIHSGREGQLLVSLNKITDFIHSKVNIAAPMPEYMARLLQNIYFRTLFSQAVHLSWVEARRNFNPIDRKELINITETKKCFLNLARQVIIQREAGINDKQLLNNTVYIKKLYEFEKMVLSGINESNSPDWSRDYGYQVLNSLSRLLSYASRDILVNILMLAGSYFQEASICAKQTDKFIAKADQKLALQAYMEANAIANRSAPDLEMYTLSNTLKFIASFRYHDEEIVNIAQALQTRLLYLLDIFPVLPSLQSNISHLTKSDSSNLTLMRAFLHSLVNMSNKKEPLDHERTAILYQAYEACVKSWYQQQYDPETENKFRLELMEQLLRDNDWGFLNLDQYLVSSVMIKRDRQNWMELQKPLRVIECGVPTYASLDGIEINYKNGQIKFVLDDGRAKSPNHTRFNTFTEYDLIEMLEKNVMGASFSLDPVDPNMAYHPFNTMRFAPNDIYKTQFLNTMLLADYVLKFLTIGAEVQGKYPYDMRPVTEMIEHLPQHLKDIIEKFHASQRHNSGMIHRFWIEAEQISEATQDDENGISRFAMTDMKMVVKKHTMERDVKGELIDTRDDDEGRDLYILKPRQLQSILEGVVQLNGPAMVLVPELNKVYFIETDHIVKEDWLSIIHMKQLSELEKYSREENGKVKRTIDNEMSIYKFTAGVCVASDVQNHFSPEYVFAQELSEKYDEFSEYFPIFGRLKQLAKITQAIRYLNIKQLEAKQKKEFYSRFLQALPDWELRERHQSSKSNYFAKPMVGQELSEEETKQIIFRHENAEKIRPLLPRNLYNKHLEKTQSIAEQTKIPQLKENSTEILQFCRETYELNKTKIKEEKGFWFWQGHKDEIKKEIYSRQAQYAREINAARDKSMREQLKKLFTDALPSVTSLRIASLVNNAMAGDFKGFAEELAKRELTQTKDHLRQMALEQSRVLDSLTAIGLGRMENKERDLEGECLWVPASVKHHVAKNSSLFIYGGVRVLPKVNVINSSDPRHRQVMGNAFNAQGRASINSASLGASGNNRVGQSSNNRSGGSNNRGGAQGGSGGVGAKVNNTGGGSRSLGQTILYQKVGPNGEHLKFGVTKNPDNRYTQSQLAGGKIKIIASGERVAMLALERKLHETLPIGPEERQAFYIKKQTDKGLKPPPYT